MDFEVLRIDKKKKPKIPRDMDLGICWDQVRAILRNKIGCKNCEVVPYLQETSAYRIGHVFVKTGTTENCCRSRVTYKILGPICNYVAKSGTDPSWGGPKLPTIKSTSDFLDFQVNIERSGKVIEFRGSNYYHLKIPEHSKIIGNVQLDRNSGPGIFTACKWKMFDNGVQSPLKTTTSFPDLENIDSFGLITYTTTVENFEIRISDKKMARIYHIGDNSHTILFDYQICLMNDEGIVTAILNSKPKYSSWESLRSRNLKTDLPEQMDLINKIAVALCSKNFIYGIEAMRRDLSTQIRRDTNNPTSVIRRSRQRRRAGGVSSSSYH